jgi:transcriptional regulator with XRE-family HTH domain
MMLSKVNTSQKSSLLLKKTFTYVFGPKIGLHRERLKIKQEDLAESMGVSRATIITWEGKEEVKLDPEQLEKLKKVLKVTLNDLTKDKSEVGEDELLNHPLVKSYQREIEALREIIELQKDKIKSLGSDKNK